MKTKRKRLWLTTIAALSLLVTFTFSCKDDNIEVIGMCPLVVSTNPANLASNVPLNQIITVTFNEVMNPVTITEASFTIEENAKKKVNPETDKKANSSSKVGTPVVGTISYSGNTATFTPTNLLNSGTTYTGRIATTVKDLMGNALQVQYSWTFSTGTLIIPTVISTDPLNLAVGIALNKVIGASFSVPMDPLTITTSTFTLMDGTTPVLGAVNYSGTTATFTPTVNLTLGKTYTATITTGAKNVPGTALASDYVWTFSTGAIIVPTVISTDPLNLSTGVALNKIINANFSVAMDPLTITTSTFTLMDGATPVLGTVNYSGTTASFTPTGGLSLGKTYTATITTGVKNTDGTAIASNYVWTFSTGAIIIPTIISTDPVNLATGVALTKVISANFSVAMDPTTITSSTFTLMDGATPVLGAVSYSGTIATFTPTSDLSLGKTYTATITTGAKNIAGTAIASNFVWTFSTGALIIPTVIATDPINLATGVAFNKVISANFSVAMDPLTITTSTFTLMDGATPVLGAVNYSGTTATFTPTSVLVSGKTYTATITTGAKNVAGTALAINHVWTFTTVFTPPTVISTDPINLAISVALNKVVSVNFSVAMDPLTITTSTFTLMDGAIPVLGAVNYSGTTATFTLGSNLLSGKTYTATVTTGAKNLVGTALANNYVWTFTTLASPPTVISVDPLNLSTGVALNKVISATFSETMDLSTINTSTFTLLEGVNPVAGSVSLIGTTAYFTPTALLLSDATYTATITTGAKNLAGTALASNYVWTFNTVPHTGPLTPDLVSVARFGIISGVGVTNAAGPSEIHDLDVGIYPGVRTSITGFMDVDGGPGLIFNGAFYAADDIAPPGVAAMLLAAKNDLVAAYLFAEGATSPAPAIVAGDLGGTTLYPGIYKSTSTLLIQSGNLTLDAQGDVNAVWIFQIASDFTTVGGSPYPSPAGGNVILSGGAQAKNIYWQVGSSAIIGDYTSFKGNILALTSITMNAYSRAEGRMLTQNAAIVLTSTNIITKP